VVAFHDESNDSYIVLSPGILRNLIEGRLLSHLSEVAYVREVRKDGRFICRCGLLSADGSRADTEIKFDFRNRDGRRRRMKWIVFCDRVCFARSSDVRDERVSSPTCVDSEMSAL
jgi:hypothetical protein